MVKWYLNVLFYVRHIQCIEKSKSKALEYDISIGMGEIKLSDLSTEHK